VKTFLVALMLLLLAGCSSGTDLVTPAPRSSHQAPSFVEEEVEIISFARARGVVTANFNFFLRNTGDREGSPSCWMLLPKGKTSALDLASTEPIPPGVARHVVGRGVVPAQFSNDPFLEDLEGFCG
jgi:hypothetical protein